MAVPEGADATVTDDGDVPCLPVGQQVGQRGDDPLLSVQARSSRGR